MISRAHSQRPAAIRAAPTRRCGPQGGAQAGDGDFRGVQAVAQGSTQERKGCGAAEVGELFLCLWIALFLGCKVSWPSGKGSHCASRARVQPQKEATLTLTPVEKSLPQCSV